MTGGRGACPAWADWRAVLAAEASRLSFALVRVALPLAFDGLRAPGDRPAPRLGAENAETW